MMSCIAVCYNRAVLKLRYALMTSLLLIALGCVSKGKQADQQSSSTPQITYLQVKEAPRTFNGQSVTFGGKVLSARRLKEGTRIEILQLPLTPSSRPTRDLSKSEGRFLALQREFLDPATVPPGTFITVTGEMDGSVTLPLDETEYSYPLVRITNLRVWTDNEEEALRIRPYMGPGPYWGPYWNPYWGPYWFPYWRTWPSYYW